jgi:hypothetical protein
MTMQYTCCDELRRSVLADPSVNINGIDHLDVISNLVSHKDRNRTILKVRFFKPLEGTPLEKNSTALKHLKVLGGEKIRNIVVRSFKVLPGDGRTARLQLSSEGDLSLYCLAVVKGQEDDLDPEGALPGFDPVLSRVEFRFRPECMNVVCGEAKVCPAEAATEPEIDYLAKDYTSFRNLMLERISLICPEWKERNAADPGVALIDLLAYVGDYLSYQQDAIATEAYIETAHKRISVRRHARLVDYFMHDGCNSRVLVQVRVNSDIYGTSDDPALPKHTRLLSRIENLPERLPIGFDSADRAQAVFETMHPVISLYENQNEMEFYTWGKKECCLARGATSATLEGDHTNLEKNSILIFQEVLGPKTGNAEDADPGHRIAIKLIKKPVLSFDPIGNMLKKDVDKSLRDKPLAVTEIVWGEQDALPFPICVSSTKIEEHSTTTLERISIALGNMVVADHGLTARPGKNMGLTPEERKSDRLMRLLSEHGYRVEDCESIGTVPESRLRRHPIESSPHCRKETALIILPRYYPSLDQSPLTMTASLDEESAFNLRQSVSHDAEPSMFLIQAICNPSNGYIQSCEVWNWRRDLISSKKSDRHFTVEVDNAGRAFIRFGDGVYGMAPSVGTKFYAIYRIGNGTSGNIGAESIRHILSDNSAVLFAWNPLPAIGGTEPESMDSVRMKCPMAFRNQERAVTPEDYASIVLRRPDIQMAVASLRWTGSWNTIFLTVDRKGGLEVDDEFKEGLVKYLEDFRMAGQDLEIEGPEYVSLDLNILVCVKPEYFTDQIRDAIMKVLSNRTLSDGRRGVFHPDNLTFGQPVYTSTIYEAAMSIEGVESVKIIWLKRMDSNDMTDIANDGMLALRRLEIARLDNDPSLPERGILRLDIHGGR